MTSQRRTKTAQEVIDYVKRQFGDEAGVQITDSDLLRWINMGQIKLGVETRCMKGSVTALTVAGDNHFSTASLPISQIEAVHYNITSLESRTFQEIEELNRQYTVDPEVTEAPTFWYDYGDTIYLWPVPTVDGDTITVFAILLPTDVVSGSDTLGVPDTHFEALCQYVMSQAYEMDEDWSSMRVKAGQVGESISNLSDMPGSFSTYPTITILEESDYGW